MIDRLRGQARGDSVVAIVTDFGARDVYAAVMKAVIARAAPRARMIDLTHAIPAGDIRAGALALWQAVPFMPRGTVFLGVVDPGVGTARRPVAARLESCFFVGPDNGLLTFLAYRMPVKRAFEISVSADVPGSTFHGRDVFAPAAARIARGQRLDRLGPAIDDPVRLAAPFMEAGAAADRPVIRGEVIAVDGFGNLVTSIGLLRNEGGAMLLDSWVPDGPGALRFPAAGRAVALPDGTRVPFMRVFADAREGEALAYIGSDGLLEIAVNRGSAARALELGPGARLALV